MSRKSRALSLLIAAVFFLSGCRLNRPETESAHEIAMPEPAPEPQNQFIGERTAAHTVSVVLYFPTSDVTGFTAMTRGLRIQDSDSLLEAAVNALLTSPASEESLYLSLADARLLRLEFANGIATVNLSIDALSVQSEQEVLALQQSIANTLLRLEGVRGVNVLVGGQGQYVCQLPMGVHTEPVSSVTASYAQLQAERDHFYSDTSAPIRRTTVLYFPTSDGQWLLPELREVSFDSDNYALALIEALKGGPADDIYSEASVPSGVELLAPGPTLVTTEAGEHILDLNFSSTLANYLAFSGLEIWELLGSVSMTMCSFMPELDGVRILVNGEAITMCEMGDGILRFPNGVIRRNHFSSRVGTLATVYLVNENNALQPVKRAVSMHSAQSPRSLVEALIALGGSSGFPRSPVPAKVYPEDVLGVWCSGSTVLVNLSASFYRSCQSLNALEERNLVYAIVNTLCQLQGIRSVRFYIEGLAADTLAGNIYLKRALMANPGIIEAPDEPMTSAP